MLVINYYHFLTGLELWAIFTRYLTHVINYTLAQKRNCMRLRLGRPGMKAVHVKRNLKHKSRPNPLEFKWHSALCPNSIISLGWSSGCGALGAISWWRKEGCSQSHGAFIAVGPEASSRLLFSPLNNGGHNISFLALLSWVKENLEQYLAHSRCSTSFSSSWPYHADLENSPACPLKS